MEARAIGTESRAIDNRYLTITAYFNEAPDQEQVEGELFEALRIYCLPISSVRDMQLSGIRSVAFSTWKWESIYLGARHKGQSSAQGLTIARLAREQRSVSYAILWGYKSPGVSFRCDGLVEWAYETAGLDIVPGDHWWTLCPTLQSLYMSWR